MTGKRCPRVARIFATAWLFGLCAAASAQAQESTRDLPFLTVRSIAEAEGPDPFFGDGRGPMRAGVCRVANVDLGGLAPLAEAVPTGLREQLLTVTDVAPRTLSFLLDEVQNRTGPEGLPADPVLYVHGYNIGFEKGCRRATLMAQNTQLAERLLWFTWPSDGDVANYTRDETDLYWSVPDLADALILLAQEANAPGQIDVIGHSLGARGLVLALRNMAYRSPETQLGEVVLVAADMDFGIFARTLPLISTIATHITIYVSDEDRPLALSEQFHGYKRLGQADNRFEVLSGVEVIDLRNVPNVTASGHLYHIYNPLFGRDLDLLLNQGMRAEARPNLARAGPVTWRLLP